MVCGKCEKKLAKGIVQDKWKEGAHNTIESGGRKVNENKALSKKKAWAPYSAKCATCKTSVAQGYNYCQGCSYLKGLCAMCGKQIMDRELLKNYKQCYIILRHLTTLPRAVIINLANDPENYDAWEALGGRDFVLLYLFYIGSGNFKQRSSLHSTGISLAIHRQSELLAVAVEAKLVGRSVAELKRMMGVVVQVEEAFIGMAMQLMKEQGKKLANASAWATPYLGKALQTVAAGHTSAAAKRAMGLPQVPPDAAARGSDAVAAIAQKKAKVAEAQACGGVGIRYHRCWVCGNTTATHGMVQNRCGRWFCFACRSALNKLEKWEGPGKGKGQGVIGGGK
ncbi:Cysteine-rich PDZ-binding [Micractinium conductrix]|uniref:Cysteine-rich PDZ-binding protein n=1 Tax=Micractinium conductrix TaxID=554055 RepID=A0A2P6VDE3_9CHLO|nr:Cysteine-rich PDZ-binding [Micractinium conductrix]|eukprot:PSC72116.1 Cysteine-rich PDZ-binding [Micractinium conductrix]